MRFLCGILILAGAVTAMSVPQPAQAALFLDGPFTGNSWWINMWQQPTETWLGNTVGPYDYVRVDYVSGSLLEIPGFQSMTNGWGVKPYGHTSTFSYATGPSNTFYWDWMFVGGPSHPTTVVDYFVYEGNTLKQAQRHTVTSSGSWSAYDLQTGPGRLVPVPEPTALATLALVLCVGAVGFARRRLRNS